jgi:hypothetical protein
MPHADECQEYYFLYINQAPEGDILSALARQRDLVAELFSSAPAQKHEYRYAPGKWNLKEVLGHVIDAERIFAYRAFCIARGDRADLNDMDQEAYARGARYRDRPLDSIIAEFRAVRSATLALFESFTDEEWERSGSASGRRFTVRTFPFILAGHERHHCKVVRDRYLGGVAKTGAGPDWLAAGAGSD